MQVTPPTHCHSKQREQNWVGGAGLDGERTQWKFWCCMFENKIPDDFENPPGHFFRSQKEDMSRQKRVSGLITTLSLCTPNLYFSSSRLHTDSKLSSVIKVFGIGSIFCYCGRPPQINKCMGNTDLWSESQLGWLETSGECGSFISVTPLASVRFSRSRSLCACVCVCEREWQGERVLCGDEWKEQYLFPNRVEIKTGVNSWHSMLILWRCVTHWSMYGKHWAAIFLIHHHSSAMLLYISVWMSGRPWWADIIVKHIERVDNSATWSSY